MKIFLAPRLGVRESPWKKHCPLFAWPSQIGWLTRVKHSDMRWDDLCDDVQTVISACVRSNLLAELSEEELRLLDREKDFRARSRQLGRSRRSYWPQLALFKRRRRPNDVELQEEEARIRTRETDRLRQIEERLFPGVGREQAREDVERTRSAFTDKCIAVGFKSQFISQFISPQERRRNGSPAWGMTG